MVLALANEGTEMLYQLDDKMVQMEGDGHYIAPSAQVIGDVRLAAGVSIWFNVVIRADKDSIDIGAGSNIQDGAVLHVDPGYPLKVGSGVTVGHKVMLHGCTVGDNSLVGINAVVLNGARIGNNCLIGANSLVPENMEIPDGSMAFGSPCKIRRPLTEVEIEALKLSAQHYVSNGEFFKQQLKQQE
jgi:carbonic anhydrase/acetyltransferase-like protein (isoleucine patch superfamily)